MLYLVTVKKTNAPYRAHSVLVEVPVEAGEVNLTRVREVAAGAVELLYGYSPEHIEPSEDIMPLVDGALMPMPASVLIACMTP